MRLKFLEDDRAAFAHFLDVQAENARALRCISNFLNENPRAVAGEDVRTLMDDCGLDDRSAFLALFAANCGLDVYENPRDRALFNRYFVPAVEKKDVCTYEKNAYRQNVRWSHVQNGAWRLEEEKIAPYEAFVAGDMRLCNDFREFAPIGFADAEYVFPSISQSGRQWMSLSPNELESMNAPLAQMRGRVAVFGLGLGYFAFMAAQKAEVCEICVVEREQQAIDLFKNQILPGLPNGEKIQIVQEDAFFFAKNSMKNAGFDTAFVDLWHDVSDGAAMYARMRALEKHSGGTRFSYWMENALLSNLRFRLVSMLMDADDGLPTPLLDYFCGADTIGLFSRVEALLDVKNLRQLAKIWPHELLESV